MEIYIYKKSKFLLWVKINIIVLSNIIIYFQVWLYWRWWKYWDDALEISSRFPHARVAILNPMLPRKKIWLFSIFRTYDIIITITTTIITITTNNFFSFLYYVKKTILTIFANIISYQILKLLYVSKLSSYMIVLIMITTQLWEVRVWTVPISVSCPTSKVFPKYS